MCGFGADILPQQSIGSLKRREVDLKRASISALVVVCIPPVFPKKYDNFIRTYSESTGKKNSLEIDQTNFMGDLAGCIIATLNLT